MTSGRQSFRACNRGPQKAKREAPSSALDPLGAWLQGGFALAPLTEAERGISLASRTKNFRWKRGDAAADWLDGDAG